MVLLVIMLVLGLIALSVIISGGVNLEFLKLLVIFAIGITVVFVCKKIYDNFKK